METEFIHLVRVLGPPAKEWHAGRGYVWQLGNVEVELGAHDCSEFLHSEDFHKYVHIRFVPDQS